MENVKKINSYLAGYSLDLNNIIDEIFHTPNQKMTDVHFKKMQDIRKKIKDILPETLTKKELQEIADNYIKGSYALHGNKADYLRQVETLLTRIIDHYIIIYG